jgi:outer membrane receptor protein involved in Fe transport
MKWALVLVVSAGAVAGGSERAELAGLIQDTTGAVLAGADITSMNEETGIRRIARADGAGFYDIAALDPGSYKVTVRKHGFQTVVRWHVKANAGEDVRLDFVMQVGPVEQVITIEGGEPPVNAEDGSVGTVVGRKAIETLPVSGRGVTSLVELAPGVVATPAAGGEAGQFSANGLRANTNSFTVDGVSANVALTGGGLPAQFAGSALPAMTAFGSTANLAPVEALDEVRVHTSSFAPQYGRLPGAQVALTTRSGSNEFHGTAVYSLRNEALNANDWFANAHAEPRAPERMYDWSATLGGPIRADRTFFFASSEGLRLREPFAITTAVPSVDARGAAPPALAPLLNAFPLPNGHTLGTGLAEHDAQFSRAARLDTAGLRIDHTLTDHVSLFGRYHWAPSYNETGTAEIEHLHLRSSSFTLGIEAMLAPTVTSDFRTNIWSTSADSSWSSDPGAGGQPLDFASVLNTRPVAPAIYGVAIGGVDALLSGASGRNHQGQWNLVETLGVNRTKHQWRFGADYERLTPSRENAAQSVTGTWNSLSDVLAGRPAVVASTHAEAVSGIVETLSLFAQDTWRISPRLNLTYGLRWELTPPPAVREPAAALAATPLPGTAGPNLPFLPVAPTTQAPWHTRYTQVAPRAGGAYRLSENSVVRAGWGIFYDLGFSIALDPINGFPFNRWQFSPFGTAVPVSAPAFGPGTAPNLKLPYAMEWNVAYERAFGLRDIVSASYVGSSGQRLLRREGILQPNTSLAEFTVATNHGASDFEGLEFQYRRRLARGLQATASYAWSHSMDNGSWDSGLYLADVHLKPQNDRGASSFDVRHDFTAGFSYALRDWQLSGMLRARAGFPIDVVTKENLLGLGFDDITRPDVVPGVPIWLRDGTIGGRRLNPAAFAIPSGVQGDLGRNAIAGAGMSQIDLALARSVRISERSTLELRFEAYNALNHPNPADPVRFLDSPFFGRPNSMLNLMLGTGSARSGLAPAFQLGGPRAIELTLRWRF